MYKKPRRKRISLQTYVRTLRKNGKRYIITLNHNYTIKSLIHKSKDGSIEIHPKSKIYQKFQKQAISIYLGVIPLDCVEV